MPDACPHVDEPLFDPLEQLNETTNPNSSAK
jgi:hypothetical protein